MDWKFMEALRVGYNIFNTVKFRNTDNLLKSWTWSSGPVSLVWCLFWRLEKKKLPVYSLGVLALLERQDILNWLH